MTIPVASLEEHLEQARLEIAALKQDKERLQHEMVRLRGLLRSQQESMSTKLKDALRE